jgi:hypothetical protein
MDRCGLRFGDGDYFASPVRLMEAWWGSTAMALLITCCGAALVAGFAAPVVSQFPAPFCLKK